MTCCFVGGKGKSQGQDMGTHMPAICQQGHGLKDPATHNLKYHHHGSQDCGEQYFLLCQWIALIKLMVVLWSGIVLHSSGLIYILPLSIFIFGDLW